MFDATCLYHFRWRKKKVDGYIIPPSYFFSRVLEIDVVVPEIIKVETPPQEVKEEQFSVSNQVVTEPVPPVSQADNSPQQPKVSALSLSSIRAKRELAKNKSQAEKEHIDLPTEPFSETDMLLIWNKFAENKGHKGQKIIEALLLINDPKLEGTTIIHELPNEGSKIEFEAVKYELTGALRGKLHNHDIAIEVIVNENISSKRAFTPQDRYNRLSEINPNLEILRKLFDLEI
ncbi:DNA polymerase III subunit gamma/tau [Flavobacterium sp. SM2513]|uniref:DNA polymerase III subunit gamma/tau n=1 Tax=Flavobacterium sp. SM2513 TaxID=3424766 RepID=UPI003D7F2597